MTCAPLRGKSSSVGERQQGACSVSLMNPEHQLFIDLGYALNLAHISPSPIQQSYQILYQLLRAQCVFNRAQVSPGPRHSPAALRTSPDAVSFPSFSSTNHVSSKISTSVKAPPHSTQSRGLRQNFQTWLTAATVLRPTSTDVFPLRSHVASIQSTASVTPCPPALTTHGTT